MNDRPEDRRRFGRVQLNPSLRGEVDVVQVSVIEISVIGARVAHDARIQPSSAHRLRFRWNEESIEYDCEVVRSLMTRVFDGPSAKTRYESGIRLVQPHHGSANALRELVSRHVVRAINEQIANARGLTPINVEMFNNGSTSGRYRRCELTDGRWRRIETTSPEQPPVGFTISAEVERQLVELLCRTFEVCNAEARDLTKVFAQLSVTPEESATPLRRYVP